MILATPIKNQIIADLEALVAAGNLGSVVEVKGSKDPFAVDVAKYPVAIIGGSGVESRPEEDQTNLRIYEFPILVLQIEENTGSQPIEDLRDKILNAFDTDFTLNGTATGSIEAAASPALSEATADHELLYFLVVIKAKTLYTLGS